MFKKKKKYTGPIIMKLFWDAVRFYSSFFFFLKTKADAGFQGVYLCC